MAVDLWDHKWLSLPSSSDSDRWGVYVREHSTGTESGAQDWGWLRGAVGQGADTHPGRSVNFVCRSPHITARLGGGRGEGEEGVKGSYRERGRSGAERVERKEGKERGEKKALLLMDIDRIWSIRYPIAPACLHGDKQVFVLAAI